MLTLRAESILLPRSPASPRGRDSIRRLNDAHNATMYCDKTKHTRHTTNLVLIYGELAGPPFANFWISKIDPRRWPCKNNNNNNKTTTPDTSDCRFKTRTTYSALSTGFRTVILAACFWGHYDWIIISSVARWYVWFMCASTGFSQILHLRTRHFSIMRLSKIACFLLTLFQALSRTSKYLSRVPNISRNFTCFPEFHVFHGVSKSAVMQNFKIFSKSCVLLPKFICHQTSRENGGCFS